MYCALYRPIRGTLKLPAFLTILSDPRVQNIPLILETPTFEAEEVWECEIKVLNMLSEVGASSGSSKDGGDTSRDEVLKKMVDEIQSVIRRYRDSKEKVGKKSASGRVASKSKTNAGKRRGKPGEEDGEATDTDDAESCSEH